MPERADDRQQPVLFLDTNAIHYAHLYLMFAQKYGLLPLGGTEGDPAERLRQEYGKRSRAHDDLCQGRRLAEYLRQQSDSGTRIEYSPITRLELTCGLLRGEAMMDAARDGIPARMWGHVDENEISHRLTIEAYNQVTQRTTGLDEQFEAASISLTETDPERMKDVWVVAGELLESVFLDVGDCTIYASALLAEADQVLTSDGYLRHIVNAIHNPGAAPETQREQYVQARDRIIHVVSRIIGAEPGSVRVPAAPKPSLVVVADASR